MQGLQEDQILHFCQSSLPPFDAVKRLITCCDLYRHGNLNSMIFVMLLMPSNRKIYQGRIALHNFQFILISIIFNHYKPGFLLPWQSYHSPLNEHDTDQKRKKSCALLVVKDKLYFDLLPFLFQGVFVCCHNQKSDNALKHKIPRFSFYPLLLDSISSYLNTESSILWRFFSLLQHPGILLKDSCVFCFFSL